MVAAYSGRSVGEMDGHLLASLLVWSLGPAAVA